MKLKNLRHIEKIEEPYVFIQIMYTFCNILISCIFEHFHEYIYIYIYIYHINSVQFSCSVVSNSLRPHGRQHARPPCPSPTPGVHPNSCPLSRWCHPTISSSVVPFSSCLQSFPEGLLQGVCSSHQVAKVLEFQLQLSVLSMNIQDWFPLVLTGLIFLQSEGLSRVFFNTTV